MFSFSFMIRYPAKIQNVMSMSFPPDGFTHIPRPRCKRNRVRLPDTYFESFSSPESFSYDIMVLNVTKFSAFSSFFLKVVKMSILARTSLLTKPNTLPIKVKNLKKETNWKNLTVIWTKDRKVLVASCICTIVCLHILVNFFVAF